MFMASLKGISGVNEAGVGCAGVAGLLGAGFVAFCVFAFSAAGAFGSAACTVVDKRTIAVSAVATISAAWHGLLLISDPPDSFSSRDDSHLCGIAFLRVPKSIEARRGRDVKQKPDALIIF
jgi:hypothetical protein